MNEPIRVQRQRSRGWFMPGNTVYVGRPSKWGNPYARLALKKSLECYRALTNIPAVRTSIKTELKGKNLACWCPLDKPCHADILLEVAND